MKQDGGILIFDSGRVIDTFTNGSIGINPKGNLFVGYDGCLYVDSDPDSEFLMKDEVLSLDESAELCLYMIDRWMDKLIDVTKTKNENKSE